MNYPAYPEYKDSGIEWLGEVPSEWSLERMSWLFSEISSGTTPSSDIPEYYNGEMNWVTTGELREKGISATEKQVSALALASHSALKVYPAGSLIIAMYGATIGRLGWLESPACTNQACCVFANPVRVTTRFAYYALSAAREHLVLLASGGGQPNINQDKLRTLRLPVPSHDEQRTITCFLDRETAKIDALIGKQEQLIATLREDRIATITHAVTKGLDPNAEMKDSGVEWLGEIPAGWELIRLRRVLQLNPVVPNAARRCKADVTFLPMEAIAEDGRLDVSRERPVQELLNGYTYFENGDVVFAKVTPCFENGKSAAIRNLSSGFGFGTSEVTVIRPGAQLDQLFVSYIVRTDLFRQVGVASMTGAGGLKRVPDERVRSFQAALPPIPEQHSIVEYLDAHCAKLDALIAKSEQMIGVLREYRSALITDAVTGKIDVRGAA